MAKLCCAGLQEDFFILEVMGKPPMLKILNFSSQEAKHAGKVRFLVALLPLRNISHRRSQTVTKAAAHHGTWHMQQEIPTGCLGQGTRGERSCQLRHAWDLSTLAVSMLGRGWQR